MKIGMVWDRPCSVGELPYGAHIGTQVLHHIVPDLRVMWWTGEDVNLRVGQWDAYIVNLFRGMRHVEQIRKVQPDAIIIALPDDYFDGTFNGRYTDDALLFIRQLQAADAIGYVSESNRQFYSAFGKSMVKIPIAMGTDNFFDAMRRMPKDDLLLTIDHSPRDPEYTIQNVATCAMIQQRTGVEVIYVNPGPETERYADALGLKATYYPKMGYEDFVRLAARARIGVDMYALHGYGRNELTLGGVGTPCLGGNLSHTTLFPTLDPWYVQDAADAACTLLTDARAWQVMRDRGLERAAEHSFERARLDMQQVMQFIEVELCHSRLLS